MIKYSIFFIDFYELGKKYHEGFQDLKINYEKARECYETALKENENNPLGI